VLVVEMNIFCHSRVGGNPGFGTHIFFGPGSRIYCPGRHCYVDFLTLITRLLPTHFAMHRRNKSKKVYETQELEI